ncbi:MAG TPA: NAD(P)-dependent oxidoreductase [Elusimicrobiota bacterium]|nr:NAD(P)-dependent oxidoreductase [Elusimicrobiota bacterium]
MPNKTTEAKILITGGAGYIGSVLTRVLLDNGYRVTVLDAFKFRQPSLLDCCAEPSFEVVRGDCRDERTLKDLLKNADVVIPLAALVGAPLCDRDPIAAETTNQTAVEMLCKQASKDQRILIPTTNSGYGVGEKGKFCTEETPIRPISLYGRTKMAAERAVLEHGNGISFRLATVFGASPRMRVDLLVNDFVYRAVKDRAVVLFEGHFKRNYVHIRDVAGVFLHGLKNFEKMKGKPYNVGLDDANLSKMELCQTIKKILPKFVFIEAPVGEDPDKRDYIVSNARILATGFRPKFSIEDGVRELVKCYKIVQDTSHANV